MSKLEGFRLYRVTYLREFGDKLVFARDAAEAESLNKQWLSECLGYSFGEIGIADRIEFIAEYSDILTMEKLMERQ